MTKEIFEPFVGRFPLWVERILLWLVVDVAQHDRLLRDIHVYRDLYEVAHEFGITFNY